MVRSSYRLVFEYEGKLFSYLKFFTTYSDNSFYFVFYGEKEYDLPVSKQVLDSSNRKISLLDFNPISFRRNKISYHKSGRVHSKDKNGKKPSNQYLSGIPFEDIEISEQIMFSLCPKIESLPLYQKKKSDNTIIVPIPSKIKPFVVFFEVYRKSKRNQINIQIPRAVTPTLIFEDFDYEFGLMLYVQSTSGEKPIWAPHHIVYTRKSYLQDSTVQHKSQFSK